MSEPAWSDESLGILRARLAQRWCQNPRCRRLLRKRTGQYGWEGACGFCRGCHRRWVLAGRPEVIPDPVPAADRNAAAREQLRAARTARVAEYASLRGRRYTTAQAAWRMGISVRTAQAYGRELRQQQERQERTAA